MNDSTDPHDQCLAVLSSHANGGGDWPPEMPNTFDAAARWWLKTIAPPHGLWDRPKVVESRTEHTTRTVYPYIERAVYTLRLFLAVGPEFQRLIVRAAEDGIYWRGDPETLFRRILAERARMDDIGVDAYREETRKKARRLRTAMTFEDAGA